MTNSVSDQNDGLGGLKAARPAECVPDLGRMEGLGDELRHRDAFSDMARAHGPRDEHHGKVGVAATGVMGHVEAVQSLAEVDIGQEHFQVFAAIYLRYCRAGAIDGNDIYTQVFKNSANVRIYDAIIFDQQSS
jgi:hypothetical protein